MGRFYGAVGYSVTTDFGNGVWKKVITEHNYYGDVIKNTKRSQAGEGINDDIVVNNTISIVADPFAYENFHAIQYVKWMGTLWKVTNVEVQRPRLILTIGGVYNGKQVEPPDPIGDDS